MSNWILPSESLPKLEEDVLATDGRFIFIGYLQEYYDPEEDAFIQEWWAKLGDGMSIDVYAWMPLPALPC